MSGIIKKISASLCLILGITASVFALEEGQVAPDFRLQDQNGEWHSLEQYRGQWVTLYFYPKDDTPGCTKEACGFRDNIFAFDELNAVVIGVSLDDVSSHAEFAEKYSLPFAILADSEKSVAKSYGVYANIVGFEMAKRESFIIGPDGKVAKHYKKVNPERHSTEVLEELKSLQES
ncbi:MAG: peroxiredoxin [Gammaproteobacteria bacterium]|nr:peroxiredoxin [Gammaproteobacteria bacterium]